MTMAVTTKAEYLAVIPCQPGGMQGYPPHGEHHIVGVATDFSFLRLGSIDATATIDDLLRIAQIMAGALPVRFAKYTDETWPRPVPENEGAE